MLVNGRFLRQSVTGVQRYAHEVTRRLNGRVEIMAPPFTARLIGNAWEQLVLPRRVRGRLLWSPANSGPLTVERQVVTIHDVSVLEHPEWFSPSFARWYNYMIPRLARRARHVFTSSEHSRQRLMERTGARPEQVSVVYCGVDERFAPASPEAVDEVRQRLALPPVYLLSLGSIEPRKNLPALIRAWEALGNQQRGARLVIAGGIGDVFREVGLTSIPQSVQLTGYVADEDLPYLLNGATGFVFPSLYEGFGLPVLEAMACGTPVAATRTTSVPEVVGDAALLFDPTSTDEMVAVLARLLDDEETRRKLRLAGLERARRFSWDVTADKIWDRLCAEARPDASA